MNNIVVFRGRAELSAEKNLESYITFAQEHALINNWEDDIWDLTGICGRTQNLKKRTRANFASRRKGELLSPSFMDGAKAVFSEFIRRKKPKEVGKHLQCLRLIEQALINLEKPVIISEVDMSVMDEAATLLNTYKDRWTRGRVLEELARDFINPAMLTPRPVIWKNPHPYQAPARRDRLGKGRAADPANSKLPDVASIIALAEITNESKSIIDQVICDFVKLAMFAPSRISEILTLSTSCITEAQAENGTLMGIAWRPVKGGQPLTKFAVTESAAEMGVSAVRSLTETGKKARQAALWYLRNPDMLYLPPGFEELRGQPLTFEQLSEIMGRSKPFTATPSRLGLEQCGTIPHSTKPWVAIYTFESCERYVLGKLPKIFPIIDRTLGLKFHEALFCLPTHILRPDATTLEYVPDIISISQIDHQLGNNPHGITVFSRNNKLDTNGEAWKLTSHQFRHLLNTLAQSKYLNQSLIAFWSGRKSVKQNDWYNHLEQDAFIEAYTKLSEQTPDIQAIGPLQDKANAVSVENMLTYREALSEEIKTVHVTRYGICRHDWALTPCPKDKDCINCGEHLFMKGEQKHLEEARNQVQLLEKAVNAAHAAVLDGRLGAKRWLKNNQPKFERWKMAVEKLTDPEIPDRTLISLPAPKVSQTQVGLTIESTRNTDDSDEKQLKDMGMI